MRSWLTGISGTKFNQTLAYNTAVNGITPTKALYNGNISAMKWKAGDETAERGYKFTYDDLDRLAAATYGEGTAINANLNRFNESVTAYDKMGNILSLQRRGKLNSGHGLMDNLTYTYTGNQLTKVTDAVTTPITYEGAFHFVDGANDANEYTYDTNGNLTRDLNKNITSISYNSLNLPSAITFSNGNAVTYVYDGSGSKLSVAYKTGDNIAKTEYVGSKIYKNGTLSMILTEEGYVTLTGGGTPTYHYYLKDHQGNNRVVVDQSGTVLQVNHYYPFGGLFGEGIQISNQPYKYNGKELDRLFGLDIYDYGARHYDPATGRWGTPDPLMEKYYPISTYVYVANNPVKYIDPNGKWIESAWDVFSLVTGAKSFVENVKVGNIGGAIVDGIGVVADGVALIVPAVPGGAGVGIKAIRAGDKVVEAVTTGNKIDNAASAGKATKITENTTDATKTFGGKQSTESVTGKEAFRKAKEANGIPRSQQPDATIKLNTPEGNSVGLDNRNVKQYEFTNSKGEKVKIRQDNPVTGGNKGTQPAHYNAGQKEKLKQHHNYGN